MKKTPDSGHEKPTAFCPRPLIDLLNYKPPPVMTPTKVIDNCILLYPPNYSGGYWIERSRIKTEAQLLKVAKTPARELVDRVITESASPFISAPAREKTGDPPYPRSLTVNRPPNKHFPGPVSFFRPEDPGSHDGGLPIVSRRHFPFFPAIFPNREN
jgi:hypothetical protein